MNERRLEGGGKQDCPPHIRRVVCTIPESGLNHVRIIS